MKAFHVVAAILFLLSAALQWNDPDPLQWMALYGSAALLAVLAATGRRRAVPLLALALVCAVWMTTLSGSLAAFVARGDYGLLVATMKATEPLIEESREFLGLLIVLAWALVAMPWRRHRPA